jgi:hypothetical protein
MRALNISRWILKRRLKDKEKRLNDAAEAEASAAAAAGTAPRSKGANAAALAVVQAAMAKHGNEAEEGHFDDSEGFGDHAALSSKQWAWYSRREVVKKGKQSFGRCAMSINGH